MEASISIDPLIDGMEDSTFEAAVPCSGELYTWMWWSQLVATAVCTFSFALFVGCNISFSTDSTIRQYQKRCVGFAQPFIFECIWRSIYPSLYIPRQVLWDTWHNSIMMDRTLAAIGEVCWVIQIHYVVQFINFQVRAIELSKGIDDLRGTYFVHQAAKLAVCFAVLGEMFSYWSTGTLNNLYATYEPCCWTVLFALFTLCAIQLWKRLSVIQPQGTRSVTITLAIMIVAGVIYVYYMLTENIPMYYERYLEDQANGVQYLPVWHGLWQALWLRYPRHDFNAWSEDWSWMTAYFSIACWSAILLMHSPRITATTEEEEWVLRDMSSGKEICLGQEEEDEDEV